VSLRNITSLLQGKATRTKIKEHKTEKSERKINTLEQFKDEKIKDPLLRKRRVEDEVVRGGGKNGEIKKAERDHSTWSGRPDRRFLKERSREENGSKEERRNGTLKDLSHQAPETK